MSAPSNLRLAMVITADATSVKTATAETRKDVASVGAEASSSEAKMQKLVATATALHVGAANSNASQAVVRIGQSADSAAGKMQALANAFAGVDRASVNVASRAADLAAYAAELDKMRAALDPLFALQQRYAAKLEQIAEAERLGAITASAAIDIRLRETATYNAQVAALDRLTIARKAAAQAIVDRQTIVPDRGADVAAALDQRHDLRARYNPVYATLSAYKTAVAEIREAQRVGALSTEEMTAAITRQRQAALASIDAIKGRTVALREAANVKPAASTASAASAGMYQTANIAAQFQDVAVTAAMGMSPIQIALQQGTQLSSVLATMGSGRQVVSGLAAALLSLVSPISLVTIGLTAGAAAAIQYFTTAESGADKTKRLFEEQNEIIRQAVSLWGDATPGLKAYVDQLDRADKLSRGREASDLLAGRQLEGLSGNLDKIKTEGAEAIRALRGDPDNAVIVRDLVSAWGTLRERLNAGTATMVDLNGVQQELARAVERYGVPQVLAFRDAFDEQTKSIYRGIEASRKLRSEYFRAVAGADNVQDIVDRSTFTDNGRLYRRRDFEPTNPPVPGKRPLRELEGDPGDRKDESTWKRALESGREQVEQMRLQAQTAGEAGVAADALRFRLGLLQRATVDGKDATAEQVKEIDKLTASYREAAAAAAAARIIADQERNLQTLRTGLSLVGAGEVARRRAISALQTEQQLKREGIDTESKLGKEIRKNAELVTEATVALERQTDAWNRYKSAGEGAIDTIFDGLSSGDFDLKSIGRDLVSDLSKSFIELDVKNPLKNMLFGSNYGTLGDLLGGKKDGGLLSSIFGDGVGTMSVNAATVMINGGDAGGITGWLGKVFGAANDNNNAYTAAPSSIVSAANDNISLFGKAIQSLESGGNYSALGPVTGNGDRAYGAYQVMGNNIGPWTRQALGYSMTPQEFLGDRSAQDTVFGKIFGGYADRYGASGAAQAWFGGPGSVGKGGNFTDILGTSGNSYVTKFNSALERLSGSAASVTGSIGGMGSGLDTATKGLGSFGGSLNQFASTLSQALGGGTGGLNISGLFSSLAGAGYDMGILSSSSQALKAVLSGSTGLFSVGGYTGSGGVHEPAGVVHRGEVVWSQRDIARAGGVEVVEAMRLGKRGYAGGGAVDVMPIPRRALEAANANMSPPQPASRAPLNVRLEVAGAQTPQDMRQAAYEGMQQALREYDADVLPDRVVGLVNNPRWR